jgi:class 3 adenylate cyclase
MNPGGPDAVSRRRGSTRGFLFADLRGYTAYLERRGANEAAELLDRYRQLVRAAVDEHDGAEIRTEGDSFYVVFPDASGAVACGLAIVAAAADASAATPEAPISVGIGVHAGETVETQEGYVGTAVNLAARLCAAAPAGDVLVSDTVRALTASVTPVRYEARGRKRFKGIAEPVAVYRAVGVGVLPSRRRRTSSPLILAGASALAGVILVVALLGGALTREGYGSSANASPVASRSPATDASIAPTGPATSADPGSSAQPANTDPYLLALVDERFHPTCRHVRDDEIPRYYETRDDVPGPNSWVLSIRGGISCEPFELGSPDELKLWDVGQTAFLGAREGQATDALFNIAGRLGASRGSCDETAPALEAWATGPLSGHLLCARGDQASVYWTYDGSDVLAKAVREDGDLESLLAWWSQDARFREP